MNPVEIEEAVSLLAEQPFDAAEFPYAFLEAFGNKSTTIKKLKSGASNSSDIGGVLQRNHIHIKVCETDAVSTALDSLRGSAATKKGKAKYILATDGQSLEAENLTTGETIACNYSDFPDHLGFFLGLAGITYSKELKETKLDRSAARRLNKLYVTLLQDNPDWGTAERRSEMNHFMARLIFCFFAEDTDIFRSRDIFTDTIDQFSAKDSSDAHFIISEIFRAMNTKIEDRASSGLRPWADQFPYVNGGLFSGSTETPKFSKIALKYLLHIGKLDWKRINPDIFGSMIQAVADDEERGSVGMHYTSVSNILKVLNPLFLDDLREKLGAAGDNTRKLGNLRTRMSKIRVFDPACGSGNFLVIAYKEMRAIEAEINKRRGEQDRKTGIPLTNFRGIELRDFPAEIARLALIIAEYQCDVLYRGQKEALAEFLPLDAMNWITCGNALRLDWLSICPPTASTVKMQGADLLSTQLDQAEIDFENEGGETYICGNPPYIGYSGRNKEQNAEMDFVLADLGKVKRLDYIACWFVKASEYLRYCEAKIAFVSTNSICQGEQVPLLWPFLFSRAQEICFAHRSFSWSNNASNNAGVSCVIVCIRNTANGKKLIIDGAESRVVNHISPYLIEGPSLVMQPVKTSISQMPEMLLGSSAIDGGHLSFNKTEKDKILTSSVDAEKYLKSYIGGGDLIKGTLRYCLWIPDSDAEIAEKIPAIGQRIAATREYRLGAGRDAKKAADVPHRFYYRKFQDDPFIAISMTSSERREFLPVDFLPSGTVVSNGILAIYGGQLHILSILLSRLHKSWVLTVCGQLETRLRYSNTLGWNTFPVPKLTEKNKEDLTRCAEDILLAREAHWPKTIADLYDPEKMPDDLRAAHDRNDEVLERIYIGRRFKNDTERLEKLFELYTKMTTKGAA